MKKEPIPFNPDDDLESAEWFSKHSTTELEGTPIKVNVIKKKRELRAISIRLDTDDMNALRELAHESGVGYTTMARMILHDRLKQRSIGN